MQVGKLVAKACIDQQFRSKAQLLKDAQFSTYSAKVIYELLINHQSFDHINLFPHTFRQIKFYISGDKNIVLTAVTECI